MNAVSSGLIAARLLLALTLLCGGIYPLIITVVARCLFPQSSAGSLVASASGRIMGSRWLAQESPAPIHFHPRPSACGYNTLPGFGSHFAVSSGAFRDSLSARRTRFQRENGLPENAIVPVDMLCASGSGLDPHISPEAAKMQIERIALARHLGVQGRQHLEACVERMIECRQWGFLGQPRVNVFLLNYMLDISKEIDTFGKISQ
jgi:potassium-transporting ATPase KdpC subunit